MPFITLGHLQLPASMRGYVYRYEFNDREVLLNKSRATVINGAAKKDVFSPFLRYDRRIATNSERSLLLQILILRQLLPVDHILSLHCYLQIRPSPGSEIKFALFWPLQCQAIVHSLVNMPLPLVPPWMLFLLPTTYIFETICIHSNR